MKDNIFPIPVKVLLALLDEIEKDAMAGGSPFKTLIVPVVKGNASLILFVLVFIVILPVAPGAKAEPSKLKVTALVPEPLMAVKFLPDKEPEK